MLPRRSDYTTPVLTTAAPPTDGPQVTILRRGRHPVAEDTRVRGGEPGRQVSDDIGR